MSHCHGPIKRGSCVAACALSVLQHTRTHWGPIWQLFAGPKVGAARDWHRIEHSIEHSIELNNRCQLPIASWRGAGPVTKLAAIVAERRLKTGCKLASLAGRR